MRSTLEARLHAHAEGTQQRAERRHEPTGAPGDHRETEAVQGSREQRRHEPAGGVVRREPGMQQPRRVEVVDLVPEKVPAHVRPAAGDRRAQPPFGAAQPATADQTAHVPHQLEGAHLAAQQAAD
jgi:hypothetical protein